MPYQTDVFGLTRPVPESVSDEDEDQYADILEGIDDNKGFVPDLEGAVGFHGPLAERPASPPFDVLYHAIDIGEWSRFDTDLDQWVAASAYVDEARQRHTDAKQGPTAAYRQVGAGRLGDLRHSQSVVGTRRLACQWPLVAPNARNSFTYSNAGTNERVQLINYQFLEQPPNMEPVLRVMASGSSDTSGETFEVGVRHRAQASGEWLTRLAFGTDTNTHQLYDEVRLNETANGSAARGVDTLNDTGIEVHADIDGTPTSGTLFGTSSIVLSWEVV